MSQILSVDGDVYDRATMLARQLDALCLLTCVGRESFDSMGGSSRDDLLSLTADLSRELRQTLSDLTVHGHALVRPRARQSRSTNEQAEAHHE